MFCRCRATVCSLITSVAGDLAVALALPRRGAAPRALAATARAARARPAGAEPREVGRRPELAEDLARRLELERCAASSSPSAEHACATSTRVRATSYGASSSSQSCRASRRLASAACRIAFRERDRASRVRGHRRQHRALVPLGELLELAARRSRLLDLARGERDLDVRRKQRRPLQRLGDLGARAADGCECRVGRPLRQPKLREPRLRLPAAAARLAVRLLRGCELPAQPEKLAPAR